jgi:hypothetical protein
MWSTEYGPLKAQAKELKKKFVNLISRVGIHSTKYEKNRKILEQSTFHHVLTSYIKK